MSPSQRFQLGDQVFATRDIYNDPVEDTGESAIPGVPAGKLLAVTGTRGVVVNAGRVEAQPEAEIYLVRFETEADGLLSQPIGCLAEELSHHPVTP